MAQQFDVFVKNVGKAAIVLPEIGGYSLASGTEINMMDKSLPTGHYENSQAALRALTELSGTVLYQQRLTGNLVYHIVYRKSSEGE